MKKTNAEFVLFTLSCIYHPWTKIGVHSPVFLSRFATHPCGNGLEHKCSCQPWWRSSNKLITPHQGVGKVFSILQAETSRKETSQELLMLSRSFSDCRSLREGWCYQIGWIFRKNPNGLRPSPHFQKIMLQIFYNGYGRKFTRRYERQIVWNACTWFLDICVIQL